MRQSRYPAVQSIWSLKWYSLLILTTSLFVVVGL